jgi:hypothetical protein
MGAAKQQRAHENGQEGGVRRNTFGHGMMKADSNDRLLSIVSTNHLSIL